MAMQQIVMVTGANQGLGFAIVKIAATRDPSAHYILACRNVEAGQKAIDDLKNAGITASLELLHLDITQDTEILKAVENITARHGKIDVLVNNAGIFRVPKDSSLASLRAVYTEMFDVNVASVACTCAAFRPLLAKSSKPKVINITSGLGSIANSLEKKMHRAPPYGTTKVAVNGLTAHLQTAENDGNPAGGKVNFYSVAPGFLKTAFTGFSAYGKDPSVGAEVVVQLILGDNYPGGTQWEYENGKMQQVPW